MSIEPRRRTEELYRPDADVTVTIVNNRAGYAFFYSGFKIVHQLAAKHMEQGDLLNKFWDGLVSVLRSLTMKDKDALMTIARVEQRPIKFVVRAANRQFVRSVNEFASLIDLGPLRERIKGHLLDRVAGYRKDLDFELEAETIDLEHVTFRRCYSYLLRTLDIPRDDPRSEHTMPEYFSTSDPRYLKAFYPAETATLNAPKEIRTNA